MRKSLVLLLVALSSLTGCDSAQEARSRNYNTLKQLDEALENYNATHVSSTPEQKDDNAMDVSEIISGRNQFALHLYDHLRSGPGNLFFSPSSISTALAMTYAGAEGQTRDEMAATMHFPSLESQLHDGMQQLQASWNATDKKTGIRLRVANRLWGHKSYEFLHAFLDVTRVKYRAELARLDFAAETEKSRQTINGWVEDQTEKKIVELIPPGVLTSDTTLVLTNAVYFKSDWSQPFDADATQDEDFHLNLTDTVKVPLMYRYDEFRYAALDDLQVLELPYGDGTFSMIVLLPDKIDGITDVEANLTSAKLQRWTADVKPRNVHVYLPKFKATSEFEMSNTLQAMGMTSAFNPASADFSRMTGNRELSISAVLHKAFVDVNEEGTEAAAATGVIMKRTSAALDEPPLFKADHPFVFLIRDNRHDAILFLGRMVNPNTVK